MLHIHAGTAPITNGMAVVTVNGLKCGVTYTILTGGTLNEDLVGPRLPHGIITTGPCPANMMGEFYVHSYMCTLTIYVFVAIAYRKTV